MSDQDNLYAAEKDAARARAARDEAEIVRDAVTGMMLNETARRTDAEEAGADANRRAMQAESEARTMATSAALARHDATHEREAAANATFSSVLVAIVLAAVVLVSAAYFLWWRPNQAQPAGPTTIAIGTGRTGARTAAPVAQGAPTVNVKVITPAAPPATEEPSAKAETSPPADTGGAADTGKETDRASDAADGSASGR